jgi:hypothetical protein
VFGSPTFFVGTEMFFGNDPIGFPQRSAGEGSMRPLAIITGVGPGTGSALVRRFTKADTKSRCSRAAESFGGARRGIAERIRSAM